MAVPVLSVRSLVCGYEGRAILESLDITVNAGQSFVLLGPNGVGKTTLFKTILGLLPAISGTITLNGENTATWSRKRFAQEVAYVPQMHTPAFGFTVREIVLMGRTPALESLGSPTKADEVIADEVLEQLGLSDLAERDYTTLSGGELQMVLIARALAQQPSLLVMDEPCANLDLGNQVRLLERIVELNRSGLAVIITSHDPNHAYQLDGNVVCLSRGGLVASGLAREVLDEDVLLTLYGITLIRQSVTSPKGEERYNCLSFLDKE